MATTESVSTRWNGHQFRSRREARWAIFLDAAGIRWKYEPRVITVSGRMRGIVYRWLPDFWLPQYGQFCEVKGFLYHDGFARLMGIARGADRDIVVLGHANDPWTPRWPMQLHRHADGKLYGLPWNPGPPRLHRAISEDQFTPDLLLAGFPIVPPEWAESPLAAARRHRFPPTNGPIDIRLPTTPGCPRGRHALERDQRHAGGLAGIPGWYASAERPRQR